MAGGLHMGAPHQRTGRIPRQNHKAKGFGHCVRTCVKLLWRALTRMHSLPTNAMMPSVRQFKRFDVRDLIRRGIEPFPEILQRVDRLKAAEGLIIVAPFLPSPLIEKLGSEG